MMKAAHPLHLAAKDSLWVGRLGPFHHQVMNLMAIEALLAAGADLEARDGFNSTPLHLAATYNNNPTVIEALLAAGANQVVLDKERNTPLQAASQNNRSCSMRKVLLAAWGGFVVAATGRGAIELDGGGREEAADKKAIFVKGSVTTKQLFEKSTAGVDLDDATPAGNTDVTYEGFIVEGKAHGIWVLRFADGDLLKGRYVEGKRHGPWVLRFADGDVWEGLYVAGEMHGDWIVRLSNGYTGERRYRNGKYIGGWPRPGGGVLKPLFKN